VLAPLATWLFVPTQRAISPAARAEDRRLLVLLSDALNVHALI
jgi:hypothetical protein